MNKTVKTNDRKRMNKFIIIFIAVFLAALLIFGAVMGTVLIVRNSKAHVKYKSVTMDGEVLAFFESYYKYQYMSALSKSGVLGVGDTSEFWESQSESGKTYGEMLKEETKNYIGALTAANYLFNSYSSLSSSQKSMISNAVKQTLEYKANGDKKLFNSETEKFGFDYDAFKTAAQILYKASTAQAVIYGDDGSKLANYPELASEYLAEYTHVKLLFIRTETAFVLDEDGNRITGDDGTDMTRVLTDAEKEERTALISEIRGYIDAIGTGEVQMGATMFDYYLDKNDEGDSDMHSDGYYFHKNSSFTAEFSEALGDVVNKSYEMQTDSFDEVTLDFGVCFIYKYAPTEGAYNNSATEMCFGDFYFDASNELFEKNLSELSGEVSFTSKYSYDAVVARPYNYIYFPVF